MLSVMKSLDRLLGRDRLAAMAERVASRSRMQVWQRVHRKLPLLNPVEARGYLRARGVGIVRAEIDQLINQDGGSIAAIRAQIEETAIQLLIEWISLQARQTQSQFQTLKAA